uniref:Interleukin 12A n=1 Tax=Cyprinodon variegatus TaxID=28743 RepID=A0A3Q2DXW8_CYPVA
APSLHNYAHPWHLTPTLLLLALCCSLWEVSHSMPVNNNKGETVSCVFYARTLLENITDLLMQPQLFSGINCTRQNMELISETNTPTVCSPTNSTCSGIITPAFDKDKCVKDMGNDLIHYYRYLSAQPDPDSIIGPSVLHSLRESFLINRTALVERSSNYNERLSLCKVLKGFQVRTVTINRAISYLNHIKHTN